MRCNATEIPHEFVPVKLEIILHTLQEFNAVCDFLRLRPYLIEKIKERNDDPSVASPSWGCMTPAQLDEFLNKLLKDSYSRLKSYDEQYSRDITRDKT